VYSQIVLKSRETEISNYRYNKSNKPAANWSFFEQLIGRDLFANAILIVDQLIDYDISLVSHCVSACWQESRNYIIFVMARCVDLANRESHTAPVKCTRYACRSHRERLPTCITLLQQQESFPRFLPRFLGRYRSSLHAKLRNDREEVRDEARDRWMAEPRAATFSNSPANPPSALAKRGKMAAKSQQSMKDPSPSPLQFFLNVGNVDVRTPCARIRSRSARREKLSRV